MRGCAPTDNRSFHSDSDIAPLHPEYPAALNRPPACGDQIWSCGWLVGRSPPIHNGSSHHVAEADAFMLGGFDIFTIVIVLLAVLTLYLGVKTVPQGYNWTVERFGRYTRILSPGLNLIVPFVDQIGRKMNMMEQVIDIPQQDVISKDNASVTVDGLAFFQVFDAAKASYEVAFLDQAIVKLAMTNIRSVMGSMDLDQMLSHRDEINERLLRVVDAAVSPWGVKVNRIEIKDIVPPADLVEAMGRQMKAEREKRAEILTAEGQRQSAILRAEGAKQSQILEAEGRREAAFRDAEARERLAQAEAKATEMVSQAIERGDVASINYFVAQQYLKAFTELAHSPNQKVLMLPIETTAVLGSLAGIAEIAKSTFGDGRGTPVPPPARPTGPAIAVPGPRPA
jgi:regulator of protease activity HflC (stomatin/prohibitin superfamily)